MSLTNSQFQRRLHFVCLLVLFGALIVSLRLFGQSAPLVIVSPTAVLSAHPGQSVSITVKVVSGVYPNGIGLIGQSPIGFAGPVSVNGTSAVLSLTIPNSLALGPYAITAVGSDENGMLQSSNPITVDVERTDVPTSLLIDPTSVSSWAIGDMVPLTVVGVFSDGKKLDLTHSTKLKVSFPHISGHLG